MIDERVHIGGLMRCCLETLAQHLEAKSEPSQEGETLDCKFETSGNQNMVFEDGAWRWNRP